VECRPPEGDRRVREDRRGTPSSFFQKFSGGEEKTVRGGGELRNTKGKTQRSVGSKRHYIHHTRVTVSGLRRRKRGWV